MSANPDIERDERESPAPDFDSFAESFFAQTDAPQDAPADAERETPVAEAPRDEERPPAETESDDDDEALPLETRFERARRREERVKQEAEAERAALEQRTRDQINGYSGRLKQEQERAKRLEAERDDLDRVIKDANARRDRDYEAAIREAPEVDDGTGALTKAQLRYAWDVEKRERDIKAKEERYALKEKQEADEAATRKAAIIDEATRGARETAMPTAIEMVDAIATEAGLPREAYQHIAAHLRSEPVRLLIERMSPPEIHEYRNKMIQRAIIELARVNDEHKERRAQKAREDARPTYRAERPVGAGGGAGQPDLSRFEGTGDTLGVLEALYPSPARG